MLWVFSYLKYHPKTRIAFDPTDPYLENFTFQENDWEGSYPDAEEEIDPRAPKPLNDHELKITIFVDASHASDWVTRRGVTGYLIFLGSTPIRWYSKRQNTVEAATYGSELISKRIANEAALDIRTKLRMLGLRVTSPVNILCDNQSVVSNMQNPSSMLKKKHLAVSWHKCREMVALGATRVAHVLSQFNIADILTKPKGPRNQYKLIASASYGCHK